MYDVESDLDDRDDTRFVHQVRPLVWWTGSSLRGGRGVLMAYLPSPDGHTGWYAEYANKQGWSLSRTVGPSRGELDAFAETWR